MSLNVSLLLRSGAGESDVHILIRLPIAHWDVGRIQVSRVNMESILLRPATQFPQEVGEALLLSDTEVVLWRSEKADAALVNDDG
jgi:hypothetical protein